MFTAVVIGGGVVGCHISIHLAERGYEVYLLEKNERLGQETSTRNSGVLHAGIYYPPASLKAKLCVEGNILSREFFERSGVAFRPTGKFIIAAGRKEEEQLEGLYLNAIDNGVPGMERVALSRVREHYPHVKCTAALYSESSAIVEAADYMQTMRGLLDSLEINIIFSCRALHIHPGPVVETDRGKLDADIVVNAAGLHSDELVRSAGIGGYDTIPLKGDYFVTRSIDPGLPLYPVPSGIHGTLGIHITPTMGRETLIGPSEILSSGKDDYRIETPRSVFTGALENMFGEDFAKSLALDEGFSGNRPRVHRDGLRCEDFVILQHPAHVFHLLGIDSPGLTAAPAIAAHVYRMI